MSEGGRNQRRSRNKFYRFRCLFEVLPVREGGACKTTPRLARRNVLRGRFNAPPPTHFRKWFPWCANRTHTHTRISGTWTVMNGDSLCSARAHVVLPRKPGYRKISRRDARNLFVIIERTLRYRWRVALLVVLDQTCQNETRRGIP